MKTRKPPKKQPVAALPPEAEEESDDRIIGQAFRWSLLVIVLVAAAGSVIYYVYNRPEPLKLAGSAPDAVAQLRKNPKVEMPHEPSAEERRVYCDDEAVGGKSLRQMK